MGIGTVLKTSRPRFWLYLAGPFLVGAIWSIPATAGLKEAQTLFQNPFFLMSFLYFLIPANILLYGINDLSDKNIDQENQKKIGRENTNVIGVKEKIIKRWFFISLIASLLYLAILITRSNIAEALWLLVFLFLSIFYSLKPIRFKSIPFLDFSSNFLYVIPGIISFGMFSSSNPPIQILVSAALWAWSMHLFSAIPDIKSDSKQGVVTSAVFLGREISLLVCLVFWSISLFIVSISGASLLMVIIGFLYPFIPVYLLLNDSKEDTNTYWKFPYLNAAYGFIMFATGLVRLI